MALAQSIWKIQANKKDPSNIPGRGIMSGEEQAGGYVNKIVSPSLASRYSS